MRSQISLALRRTSMGYTVAVIVLARLALNMQARLIYPFLPAIGRGLGVPLETASLLLTVRALAGITSPLYGMLSDRVGRRTVMLLGMGAMVGGAALVAGAPSFGIALGAFVLLGMSKASYDPAVQAYVGDIIPYAQRGRILSLTEMSWAGSWLIGVPAAGFLIAAAGWRAPFVAVALLGGLGLLLTWQLRAASTQDPSPVNSSSAGLPARGAHREKAVTAASSSGAIGARPARWASRPVVMALLVSMFLALANENVFVIYGAWMESSFGLSVTSLGLASVVIALAELVAESASAGLVDRVGKRRAVLGGLILNVLAYVALARVSGTLGSALTGVVGIFLTFEFAIVAMLPLVSELAPAARGTVMALNAAAIAAGRLIGSLSAPRLWNAGGLPLNALTSAALMAIAVVVLWRGVSKGSGQRAA